MNYHKSILEKYAEMIGVTIGTYRPSSKFLNFLKDQIDKTKMCSGYVPLDSFVTRNKYKETQTKLLVAFKSGDKSKMIGFILFAPKFDKKVYKTQFKQGFNIDHEIYNKRNPEITEILDICALSPSKGGVRGVGSLLILSAMIEGNSNGSFLFVGSRTIQFKLDGKEVKHNGDLWTSSPSALKFYKKIGFENSHLIDNKGEIYLGNIIRVYRGIPTPDKLKKILFSRSFTLKSRVNRNKVHFESNSNQSKYILIEKIADALNVELSTFNYLDEKISKIIDLINTKNMCDGFVSIEGILDRVGYEEQDTKLIIARKRGTGLILGFSLFAPIFMKEKFLKYSDLEFNNTNNLIKNKDNQISHILDICTLSKDKGGIKGVGSLLLLKSMVRGGEDGSLFFVDGKEINHEGKTRMEISPSALAFYNKLGFKTVDVFKNSDLPVKVYNGKPSTDDIYRIMKSSLKVLIE